MYDGHLNMVSLCETDVVTVLQTLDATSAVGPKEVHPRLLSIVHLKWQRL